jgi:hypothetical protein
LHYQDMMGTAMFIGADDRRARYTAFVLLALAINVIDGIVMRSIADPGRRTIVAAGASFDVVVVVSALYYWMLVRPSIRAPGSLVAIVLTGVLRATYFYRNGLAVREILAGLCEAGFIAFVIVQVRNIRRTHGRGGNTDPLDAIRAVLASVLPAPGMVKLLAAELSILYYGLFSWRAKPHVASCARAFWIYERVGQADVLGVLPILCVLEIVPVHLLLRHWSSPALAWIATGVSMYGAIWLIGLARALRLRPVLVGRDYLHLRYGLLFQLRVPKEMIARVRRAEAGDKMSAVPRKSEPSVCIELARVMDAEGLFGIRKRVNRIAVTPDDEPAFKRAIAELMSIE